MIGFMEQSQPYGPVCPRGVNQKVAGTLVRSSMTNAPLHQEGQQSRNRSLKENKVQEKGCLTHRVKIPPLTNEANDLEQQSGSRALQLLLYVFLLLLHKWDNKGVHHCKLFVWSAREICPWLTNTTCDSTVMTMPFYVKGDSNWRAEEDNGEREFRRLLVLWPWMDRQIIIAFRVLGDT